MRTLREDGWLKVKLGLTTLLRRSGTQTGADDDMSSYLSLVDSEVDKCIRVTKRLLDLSHVPSQSLQLVSFTDIVPDVVSLLRYEAEQSDVELDMDLGNDDLRVIATDAELRMLVLNLVQNAFHAMPQGGTLTIVGRREHNTVRLSFTDNGIGITADAMAHIFEPFFSKRADGVQGTGLGLTICKAIATRYQGNIVAKSDAGKGAAFTITFPYAGTSEVLP